MQEKGKKKVIDNAGALQKKYAWKSEKTQDTKKAPQDTKKPAAVCPYAKKCGGCDYQGMSYEQQLQEKQTYVRKNIGDYCKVLPIIGMENPYHYRNKVHAVFDVERRGKQLLPTKDGHNLACVLPEVLTSPQLTAQWETELTAIAKGQADPEGFMAGIAEMTRGLIVGYSQISEDAQKLFHTERVVIGKCPRCGESVYEGKKNYYCGNRSCQVVMWKNDRFFEERGKAFTPKIAAALLKDGKAKVKGLRSMKIGKTYDGTVHLADTGGKYVNYRVEQRGKN